jgi:acetylornithine deacetylase/succinyl-diaminopimelate desuccinylase-like protein
MRHILLATALITSPALAAPPAMSAADSAATKTMFETVINTPTVLGRGKVPEMASYLAGEFKKAGFADADVMVMPYDTTGDKTAALMVIWRAGGKPAKRPVMMMGHMDVVEAKREDSTTDPFVLTERDGYYYGRGTIDMKAGIVGISRALIQLKAQGFKPKRDIVAFFTGDEETNGIGAEKGATDWRAMMGNPELGLNADGGGIGFLPDGKPLGARIQTAEKTFAGYTFSVTNRGGHSSKPRKDNAIYELAGALKRLEAYRFAPMQNETSRAAFAAAAKVDPRPNIQAAINAWLANPNDGAAADAIEADETYTGLTRTRCVATELAGGHAPNALPQLAKATINCRIFPGVDPNATLAELKTIAGPGVTVTRQDDYVASLASPLRPDVVAAVTKAVTTIHPGMPVAPEMSTGASDARPFRVAGIPVYGVGGVWVRVPIDLRAHGKDERLPIKALDDNVKHWMILATEMAGGAGRN